MPYTCNPEDVLKAMEKDRENYFFIDVQVTWRLSRYAKRMFERKEYYYGNGRR